jgi:hypothetical protein
VVTDDRGRYVLPDLPQANYSVCQDSGPERVSRNRTEWQWHSGGHEEPGRVVDRHQNPRLQLVSPTWQQCKTPNQDLDLIESRLKQAERHSKGTGK